MDEAVSSSILREERLLELRGKGIFASGTLKNKQWVDEAGYKEGLYLLKSSLNEVRLKSFK